MKSTVLLAVLLTVVFNRVLGNSCGGILEGEQGHFSLANASNEQPPETPGSSCLWIIQLHYENNIQFTLDALSKDALLNLYPEDQLGSCSLNNNTMLNWTQVGSSLEFLGKTLIIILPNSSASVSFSWHFIDNVDKNNTSVVRMNNADYIISPNGLVEWGQVETVERVTWGINTNANFHIKWDVDIATRCDNCACFHFALFKHTSEGFLSEALRTCGQSSEGKLEGINGRVVVLMKVNTKVEANNKVAVSWGLDDVIVTEPPVTEVPTTEPTVTVSPVPTATGLFAATQTGLIALNLQTLEATSLTSEHALAVAVNPNLKKVYWSELWGNSRIMRSNLNGSATEVIVPPTGASIRSLAVHEPSGNIYFGVLHSNEITVCNALGENCATVISSSSLANDPWSIAFDYENNVMYWSNSESGGASLIRANLDGSNATIISSGFSHVVFITLEQHSNDILYWADDFQSTIGTIDVNGGNKGTLVKLEGSPWPNGIQVDAHKIYIGNWNGKTIQSVDKDSGENLTTIFNSTDSITHLALFSAPT